MDSSADKEERKREVYCSPIGSYYTETNKKLQYNRLAQREFRMHSETYITSY